jgi:hypothetical protein
MKKSKKDLFLELAKPDEQGFSRDVKIEEFVGDYQKLKMGNGGDWCRDDGKLAEVYNIVRVLEKGKITSVRLEGFKKIPIDKQIRKDIVKFYKNKKCVVLDVSNVEIDHKDGRRDDPRISDVNTQKQEDFQPLSKCVNNAKRQHCKVCRETGIRYDATRLGYQIAQYKGGKKYNGSCIGCYWYDPFEFNKNVSKK